MTSRLNERFDDSAQYWRDAADRSLLWCAAFQVFLVVYALLSFRHSWLVLAMLICLVGIAVMSVSRRVCLAQSLAAKRIPEAIVERPEAAAS